MVELVGNIPDDVVLQARLDILYGQTPDITIKAHELPEESGLTVEKSGTLAEPVFDIGIPQAMGAVAAREYAKQAEAARDAAVLAGETAKEELNGIVAFADDALDQKITETGIALDEKVATAAQRASEAASSAAAAAQKAAAAEQAMQGAQAAQAQAEQSAQEAAENTAMAKDFASGQPVTYSGTPVSIAYAGAQRIAAITAYGENAQGGTTEAPVALTGISSVTVDDVTELPIPRPLRRVGDVKDKCVTRQDYESAEKLVVTYNVGFVELDGTETSHLYAGIFYLDYSAAWPTPANRVNGVCSHYPYGAYSKGKIGLTDNGAAVVYNPNGDYTGDEGGLANWKAYLAAQKEAGTPVQIAYQLATPEVYATDPVDFDNAAGPLIIMTGGAVEVRMTELIGSRTYDADGDGVVDEAEKVSNALTLKNAAGEVVATFDGSEAAILQLTAALVGALGKTEKAADSSKLAGLTPIIDNPSSTNNRNTWYFPFTGTNNKDGTRKYYAALYADEATRAANKVGGGALVDTNDGRLSNARRASNITMGYDGNLWISYS